mgnify:CR=1 FL=1
MTQYSLYKSKYHIFYFIEWITEIVNQKGFHIAVDRKIVKSAKDKGNNDNEQFCNLVYYQYFIILFLFVLLSLFLHFHK